MRLGSPTSAHLTYCTNIHPGETWPEVRENLERHVTAVKSRLAPDQEFGVGLRLGGQASKTLDAESELEAFQDFLKRSGMYVFTINGFPYGTFHGAPVKEQVYRPDWSEPERVEYTDRLARILARLLPDEEALEGSVSTVPGAFKPVAHDAAKHAQITANITKAAASLFEIAEQTGKVICLALEPEPYCMLETVGETVRFYEEHLWSKENVALFCSLTKLSATRALDALRRHVGVCLDTCHAAVEFEEPGRAVADLRGAGIRIAKVQLSAGLRLSNPTSESLRALAEFDESTYLHQVVERAADGALRRYPDLSDAFAAAREGQVRSPEEWRVHFHVPIFLPRLKHFDNTQPFLEDILSLHRDEPLSPHLEVETYTWDVLPEEYRNEPVDDAIARELRWVRERLEG